MKTTLLVISLFLSISAHAQFAAAVYSNHLTATITGNGKPVRQTFIGYTIFSRDPTNGVMSSIQLLAWTKPSPQFIARTNHGLSAFAYQVGKTNWGYSIAQARTGSNSVETFTARGTQAEIIWHPAGFSPFGWEGPNPAQWSSHAIYSVPGLNYDVFEDTSGTLTLDVQETFESLLPPLYAGASSLDLEASSLTRVLTNAGYTQTTDYLQ